MAIPIGRLTMIFCAFTILLVCGCAGSIKSIDITPDPFQVADKYQITTHVTTDIYKGALTEAIESSIQQTGVLRLAPEDNARLHLFVYGNWHMRGELSLVTALDLNWLLLDTHTKTPILWESVITASKATLSDALVGAKRLNIARTRAMKSNVKRGVQRLSDSAIDKHLELATPDTTNVSAKETLEDGINQLKAAINLNPEDAKAHYKLGLLYSSRILHTKLRKENLLGLINGDIPCNKKNVQSSLSAMDRTTEDLAKAIDEFEKAIDLDENYTDAYHRLAMALSSKGEHRKSIKIFKQLIQLEPNNTDYHWGLARQFVIIKDNKKARGEFELVLQLDPNYPNYHRKLGGQYWQMKDYERAREEFRTALQLDPNSIYARRMLANSYRQMGELDVALEMLQKAIETNPSSAMFHRDLGTVLEERKDHDGALEQYKTAIDLDPDDALSHYFLAEILMDQGDLESAITEYMIAAELDSSSLYLGSLMDAAEKIKIITPPVEEILEI